MSEKLNEKEVVSFKEALISQMAHLDAITRLLIEKGVITEAEFFAKLKQVQGRYDDTSQGKA